jgi:RNA polymerase sigma-70 factor (ECF subfamily)
MSREDADRETLMERACQGDDDAMEQLLQGERDRLRRVVGVRIDPRILTRVDPSDIVQEVFMMATDRFAEYARTRPLPFFPWLRQIAWERLIAMHHRHVRAKKRTVLREEPVGMALSDASVLQLADKLAGKDTSPSGQLLREEMRLRVRQALDALPEPYREVLVMRHLEQLRIDEIAAILGIERAAVKMRCFRAAKRLRGIFDHQSKGGDNGNPA